MSAFRPKDRAGFTLVELLVVVVVIAILAGILLPALAGARRRAEWTQCQSNLHQFSLAWMQYRFDHNDKVPDWLSSLYPDYCGSKDLYVCPGDEKRGLIDGSKPQDLLDDHASDAFNETDDNKGRNGIDACSYFYEMSGAECSLGDALPGETWGEYKVRELRQPDVHRSDFPVIRCYHHWRDRGYTVEYKDGSIHEEGMTINVAYDGNIFFAPENWNFKSFKEH